MITDSEGAAIGKARVLLHWDSIGSLGDLKTNMGIREDRAAIIDKNGHFEYGCPGIFMTCWSQRACFRRAARRFKSKAT